jgi:hypothetical protein
VGVCVAGVLLEGDCERCRSCTAQRRGSVEGSVNVSARRVGARKAKASLRSFRVAARASIMVLACWIAVYGGIKQTKVIKNNNQPAQRQCNRREEEPIRTRERRAGDETPWRWTSLSLKSRRGKSSTSP